MCQVVNVSYKHCVNRERVRGRGVFCQMVKGLMWSVFRWVGRITERYEHHCLDSLCIYISWTAAEHCEQALKDHSKCFSAGADSEIITDDAGISDLTDLTKCSMWLWLVNDYS